VVRKSTIEAKIKDLYSSSVNAQRAIGGVSGDSDKT